MKLALAAALAASVLIPATVSRADDPIVVQSQRIPVERWVGSVSRDLNRSLAVALRGPMRIYSDVEGFASVSFKCGADGRPTEMTLIDKAGGRHLPKVALRAVRGLESLHPLPDGTATGQRFRANIIVADDQAALSRYARLARTQEAQRARADRGRPDAEIAIGIVVRTSA